ncbi:ATP synthase F1 subunit gamma [Muribaculum intestinale]|jgi:F-type H+-transporting ATPase subunit gamma|uniref:ATP synthase F1 subunit gamma n=4 Tax=Muribaculum intestinale TaxID=1796646 RepID=UPI00080F141C|nr:ATP synthase F1 subunit gamma [Muribaculum intestinale]GFI67437.1 ATP synthase gamma chain [Muribaculaceae bacterium]
MATLRELKGRIGSVKSSEKITGAMKMISSAKMHKAEQSLRRLLPFRGQIETIMGNLLSADAEFSSPLTLTRDVTRAGIAVWGSDDGLCGAYNINIFKGLLLRINQLRERYGASLEITLYPVGNKMVKATRKLSGNGITVEVIGDIHAKSDGEAVKAFTSALQQKFLDGDIDMLDLLYMNFKSMSRQTLRNEQLLPVVHETLTANAVTVQCRPYIFEPDANTIFNSVLPLFILAVVQEIFTENVASEQAARIMAMQSANDNAKKLLEQLQLEYNKLRQQAITSELLDILGGQVR